jgi:hypothetical protein
MFKKTISTLQKLSIQKQIQIKNNKNLIKENLVKNFCTLSNTKNNFYPDTIVQNLRNKINNIDEEELKEIETDIVNKIHFFDADQYADVLILLARLDKGSDLLWEVLSRKVFDYEFDYIQSEALLTALNHTDKCYDYVLDDLKKNMYRYHTNQNDPTSKLFRSFYY